MPNISPPNSRQKQRNQARNTFEERRQLAAGEYVSPSPAVSMLDPINESNYQPKTRLMNRNSKNHLSLKGKSQMNNGSKDRYKRVISTFNKKDWNKAIDNNNSTDTPMI